MLRRQKRTRLKREAARLRNDPNFKDQADAAVAQMRDPDFASKCAAQPSPDELLDQYQRDGEQDNPS